MLEELFDELSDEDDTTNQLSSSFFLGFRFCSLKLLSLPIELLSDYYCSSFTTLLSSSRSSIAAFSLNLVNIAFMFLISFASCSKQVAASTYFSPLGSSSVSYSRQFLRKNYLRSSMKNLQIMSLKLSLLALSIASSA